MLVLLEPWRCYGRPRRAIVGGVLEHFGRRTRVYAVVDDRVYIQRADRALKVYGIYRRGDYDDDPPTLMCRLLNSAAFSDPRKRAMMYHDGRFLASSIVLGGWTATEFDPTTGDDCSGFNAISVMEIVHASDRWRQRPLLVASDGHVVYEKSRVSVSLLKYNNINDANPRFNISSQQFGELVARHQQLAHHHAIATDAVGCVWVLNCITASLKLYGPKLQLRRRYDDLPLPTGHKLQMSLDEQGKIIYIFGDIGIVAFSVAGD